MLFGRFYHSDPLIFFSTDRLIILGKKVGMILHVTPLMPHAHLFQSTANVKTNYAFWIVRAKRMDFSAYQTFGSTQVRASACTETAFPTDHIGLFTTTAHCWYIMILEQNKRRLKTVWNTRTTKSTRETNSFCVHYMNAASLHNKCKNYHYWCYNDLVIVGGMKWASERRVWHRQCR